MVWPARHVALVRGRRVALTKGEGAMLQAMIAARGEPVSRSALAAVWSRQGRRATDRSVDTRIYALRKKLGDDARAPRLIVTVSGVGYGVHIDFIVQDRDEERVSRQSRRSRVGAT
jgi:two-component system OmpR family response regulator